MVDDVDESGLSPASQTIGRILVEEAFEDGRRFDGQRSGYADRLLQDDCVCTH